MAQEYPSRYVCRGSATRDEGVLGAVRDYDACVDDERLIELVDANLIAFARHMATSIPAGTLEEREHVLLIAGDDPTPVIVNSAFATGRSADPGSILPVAAAFYGRLGHGYGLWTRAHADAALEALLPAAGFTLEIDLPVMVLEARPAQVPAPAGAQVRRVVDEAAVEDFRIADREGFGEDDPGRAAVDSAFRDPGSLLHPAVAGYVAYVDSVPAAAAMSFTAGDITRVGWVGTVPAFRRRGLGAAVTRAAMLAGFDAGASLAALESSPVGVPLYRSLGFRTITNYRVWSIG
jgi:ribosomal protein S18 acetylase RimI-like enzyme